MNQESRDWSQRFFKRFGKMPTREHATTYATITHYLTAVKSAKTDDSKAVMAAMKAAPMKFFGSEGRIREDGRFIHDLNLYEVKSPSESKYPWDYYKVVAKIPGEEAFGSMKDSQCAFLKSPK
jgi:branched-chain amino acid transport system substrate-binding protein